MSPFFLGQYQRLRSTQIITIWAWNKYYYSREESSLEAVHNAKVYGINTLLKDHIYLLQ
jgi:hypothetical protein